jgi:preprotein translocase subunit SecF
MSKRWYFIGFSLALLILSVVLFIKPGPKLGTDFKGGTELEVAFTAPVTAAEIRASVERAGFSAPDVVAVNDRSNPHRYLIRVKDVSVLEESQKETIRDRLCLLPEGAPVPEDRCPPAVRASEVKFSPGGDKISMRYEITPDLEGIKKQIDAAPGIELRAGANNPVVVSERDHKVEVYLKSKGDQLLDALRRELGADRVPEQALRVEWIGPKAGAQLRDSAIKSIVISIFFIMAYVAFRFDLRFAPGGIIALVHDVGIALGVMVLFGKEITLTTVAALLMLVGYSITDTVVVYDRIRENLAKHRDKSFSDIINLSISEMLGRTLLVSIATLLSLMMFFIWGTGTLKDLAFTLVVGMIVGIYSSIYVAAPLTEWIDRKFFGASTFKRRKVSRMRAQKRADAVV